MTEKIIWEGDEFYDTAFSYIQKAKKSVYLEMYIFRDDNAGNLWKEQLIKAAKKGLNVRVIYDRIGSFSSSSKFWEEMENHNIEVFGYRNIIQKKKNRFLRKVHLKYPLWLIWIMLVFFRRDHRKILIIDEKIAFIGGFNIMNAASYKISGKNRWLDAFYMTDNSILVKEFFNIHFDTIRRLKYQIRDFLSIDRKKANEAILFPFENKKKSRVFQNNSEMNLVARMRYSRAVKKLIKKSRKKIYIVTPYFVPRAGFLRRLIKKAKKKADVRLYLSYRSDLIFVQYVSLYLARKLLKHGIKVFLFHGKEKKNDPYRFNHSKVFLLDDWVGVGSGNVDSRSFFHNLDIHIFRKNEKLLNDTAEKIKWIEKYSYEAQKKDLPIKLVIFFLLPFRRFL